MKRTKTLYFREKFHSCMGDLRKTYRNINSIIGQKTKRVISEIFENGVTHNCNMDIAKKFNQYIVSIASNLRDGLPPNATSHMSYMGERSNQSIIYEPVTAEEIINLINNLNNTNNNIHSLPAKILKKLSYVISPVLSSLINSSMHDSVFPSVYKVGHVTPIYKTGKVNQMGNYRPITILPVISKVYERAVYNRLIPFLSENETIVGHQFGFRSGLSTSDAIDDLLESCYESLNSSQYMVAIFLDLSKAFDTLSHQILLDKLEHMGIRNNILLWLKSYLSARKQCTIINSVSSPMLDVKMGVPQGSILGPLLFLLYINDMSKCGENLKFIHFADDTTIIARDININRLFTIVQRNLNLVDEWLVANQLILNTNKSSHMIITNKTIPNSLSLNIRGTNISHVSCQTFLGILIDSKLTFKPHITEMCKKISRSIGILFRLSTYVPNKTLASLYFSLINSYLCYGITSWGGASPTSLLRVKRLQKISVDLFFEDNSFNDNIYNVLSLFCSAFTTKKAYKSK